MKLLIVLDASPVAKVILDEVSARPWPSGSSASILTVVEPSFVWHASEMLGRAKSETTAILECAASRLRSGGLSASIMVDEGDPKACIIEEAERTKPDLLILGSYGHGGLTRFVLGSVAGTVLWCAPGSVEIVRPRASRESAALRGMRVLLATDGSEGSLKAARSIAARPWPRKSEFEIASVIEQIAPAFQIPYFDPAVMAHMRQEALERSQEALLKAEETLTAAGLNTSSTVLVPSAEPKELILTEAERWAADLIVVGSHGRRGLRRFLIGSTSEAIATHADCSVEIIR